MRGIGLNLCTMKILRIEDDAQHIGRVTARIQKQRCKYGMVNEVNYDNALKFLSSM